MPNVEIASRAPVYAPRDDARGIFDERVSARDHGERVHRTRSLGPGGCQGIPRIGMRNDGVEFQYDDRTSYEYRLELFNFLEFKREQFRDGREHSSRASTQSVIFED